jgi:CRP-like cAMP-binding protein
MSGSQHHDLQRFADRLTGRSVLNEAEEQAIIDLPGEIEHVQSNRDFVRLGERVHHASFVVEGLVGRFGQNRRGGRQITALHVPGDMADLHSVVQPAAASALQAMSVATILRVPHVALRAISSRYPAIAEALWRDCATDASVLSQWVVNVGRKDAKQRVAHLLCEMATRIVGGKLEGEVVSPFAMTQTQLADATGLTAVHMNRTVGTLRRERLADISGQMVRIPDWEALVAAGEFSASYLHVGEDAEPRLRIALAS